MKKQQQSILAATLQTMSDSCAKRQTHFSHQFCLVIIKLLYSKLYQTFKARTLKNYLLQYFVKLINLAQLINI